MYEGFRVYLVLGTNKYRLVFVDLIKQYRLLYINKVVNMFY